MCIADNKRRLAVRTQRYACRSVQRVMGGYCSRVPAGCVVVEYDVDVEAYSDYMHVFPVGGYVEHATDVNENAWTYPGTVAVFEADGDRVTVQGGCGFGRAGVLR